MVLPYHPNNVIRVESKCSFINGAYRVLKSTGAKLLWNQLRDAERCTFSDRLCVLAMPIQLFFFFANIFFCTKVKTEATTNLHMCSCNFGVPSYSQLGKMQHAVFTLLWHSHFVAMARQFVIIPIVIVPVINSFHIVADGELQNGTRLQNKRWHRQTKSENICCRTITVFARNPKCCCGRVHPPVCEGVVDHHVFLVG